MTGSPRPVVPGSVGVFGGTFDPIHVAHLAVAQEAAESLGLERVLFIPAGQPPHKPGLEITSGRHRLAYGSCLFSGCDRAHRQLLAAELGRLCALGWHPYRILAL